MTISLARPLLGASCSLPGAGRVAPLRLLDLAPGGVCLAARIAARAGGLLHRRFTLARRLPQQASGNLFSVALCRRVAPPGFSPAPYPLEGGLSSPRSMPERGHPVCLDTPLIYSIERLYYTPSCRVHRSAGLTTAFIFVRCVHSLCPPMGRFFCHPLGTMRHGDVPDGCPPDVPRHTLNVARTFAHPLLACSVGQARVVTLSPDRYNVGVGVHRLIG